MKRVSSRQRLVSWDAFDAAANSDDDSSSFGEGGLGGECSMAGRGDGEGQMPSDLQAPQQQEQPLGGRKRERSPPNRHRDRARQNDYDLTKPPPYTVFPNVVPAIIPRFPWEVVPMSPPLELESLAQDARLHVLSFLDADDLGSVMGTCCKFRRLLLSGDAHVLWLQHCRRHWKHLPAAAFGVGSGIVDSMGLPSAAGMAHETYDANLRLLFSMTPPALPTRIDKSRIEGPSSGITRLRNRVVRRDHLRAPSRRASVGVLETYQDEKTGEDVVRFLGPVGSGDRCIRSDHPLPKPTSRVVLPPWTAAGRGGDEAPKPPTIMDLLRHGAMVMASKCSFGEMQRPFCAPYVDRDGATVQATPRLVAYFEASILNDADASEDGEGGGELPRLLGPLGFSRQVECTAIGIATDSFNLHSRMPGWDSRSYGYHGDDGGIYHSSGGMVQQYGPTFGAGDTVGCGIDYVENGIFYTLNGKFLGYAWKGIDREFLQNRDWYPVVGIDTNAPITVNFGQRPFAYDLKQYNKRHEMLISPFYQYSGHRMEGFDPHQEELSLLS